MTEVSVGDTIRVRSTSYDRYCDQKDAEPSHSDKAFCEEYRRKYGDPDTAGGGYTTDEPKSDKSDDDDADSGPLAFTGLDVWQLALIAVVLIGGGFLVRRHLTS